MFQTRQAKEIFNLLAVLSLGVLAAMGLTVYFLYYYNPQGTYLASNTMLSLQLVKSLGDQEGILLTFYDPETKEWKTKTLPLETYDLLYQKLSLDRSLRQVSQAIFRQFSLEKVVELTILEKGGLKPFQKIQFSIDGPYYRIELKEQNPKEPWAYFENPFVLKSLLFENTKEIQ